MKRKKILFHINSMGKGGAERVVSVLSGCFAEDGYEVAIVTLWQAGEEYELAGAVKRINLEDLWQGRHMGRLETALRRLLDLRRIIKEEKPDLVISFCNKANFRCAYAMYGMTIPLLVSVRNDPRVDYLPHRFSVKRMEKRSSGCVFQTPDARACFDRRLQEKSRIIWNPVDERYLRTDGRSEKSVRKHEIVAVGRLSPQKNQLLLLKAFHRIRGRFPDYVVKLYGEESEPGSREALLAYVKEQGMDGQVQFMGQSSHLEEEIRDAALFVLPSNYEGMPNALMEAMVLGLPVIATDCPCGGPAELIEEEVSGMLVPVGDVESLAVAMERVLTDQELAERLGRNAGKLAEKVSPGKVYEEWKQYAEELMK